MLAGMEKTRTDHVRAVVAVRAQDLRQHCKIQRDTIVIRILGECRAIESTIAQLDKESSALPVSRFGHHDGIVHWRSTPLPTRHLLC